MTKQATHHHTGKTPSQDSAQPNKKLGRNDPCPCGSGKKYKKCCIDNEHAHDGNDDDHHHCEHC